MFGGLAHINTSQTRAFSHSITFAIDVAVFTNIIQYSVAKTNRMRKGKPFCRKWGPVMCLVIATLMVNADLVRHLINDNWGTICTALENDDDTLRACNKDGVCRELGHSPKYSKYCYSQPMMNQFSGGEGFPHESFYGWTFSIFGTWGGYILLFVGIFWVLSLPQKFKRQWRAARGVRRSPQSPLIA